VTDVLTVRLAPRQPRQSLRLSAILVDLAQDATPADQGVMDTSDQKGGSRQGAAAEDASRTGRHMRTRVRSNITVNEILDRTRRAGFGFIVALLALVAIPFMGLSTPFGLAIALLGGQMIAGRARPWLPRRVRGHRVSMASLLWLGQRVARWTTGLERVIRPRFSFLTEGPFWTVCGVAITLQGLGLALPLPIPGSNWIFIIPIIAYGIGLLESDGLLIMVCHTITLVQVMLGCWLWEVIVHALVNSWNWFWKLFA
jgi:hypothetical protein